MASVQFNGHDTLTYPDYVDAATGRTLVAVPGQSYTTAVAPGRNAGLPAVPGDGRWGSPGVAAPFPASPRLPELPPAPQGASTVTTPAAPEGAPASPESED